MKLTTLEEKIEAIEEAAHAVGGTVRDSYSGRGMYGRTCYGIDCDDDTECVVQAARRGLPTPSIDQMGRGYIVYWKTITKDAPDAPKA